VLWAAPSASALVFDVNSQATLVEHVYKANTPKSYRDTGLLYKADFERSGVVESGETDLFEAALGQEGLLASLKFSAGPEKPEALYLALKSSNEYVVWDIRGWDPTRHDALQVLNDQIFNSSKGRNGTRPQQISHVSIYGSRGAAEVVSIPDGGRTALLLGGGVGALLLVGRRWRRDA